MSSWKGESWGKEAGDGSSEATNSEGLERNGFPVYAHHLIDLLIGIQVADERRAQVEEDVAAHALLQLRRRPLLLRRHPLRLLPARDHGAGKEAKSSDGAVEAPEIAPAWQNSVLSAQPSPALAQEPPSPSLLPASNLQRSLLLQSTPSSYAAVINFALFISLE